MDRDTLHALDDLNRRFYERHARTFDASRHRPWPGWERLLGHLPADSAPLSVLDLGCGNGRFGRFLRRRRGGPLRYRGVDRCRQLLRAAAAELRGGGPSLPDHDLLDLDLLDLDLLDIDLLDPDLDRRLEGERFDLVALFGVLHHLPGRDVRRRFLAHQLRRLRPGGRLAVSIWRRDLSPDFARKVVPWERIAAAAGIDRGQLEPGDHLLGWAGDRDHPRYCHFPDQDEIEGWTAEVGSAPIDRYAADGPTGHDNLYLIFGT